VSTVKHTDYYKALGISPEASPRQVKESYLGWIRHFDRPQERPKPGSLEGSLIEQIEQVQEAYDLLSDEAKREAYNARMHLKSDPVDTRSSEAPVPPRAVGEVEVMVAKRKLVRTYLDFFGLNAKPFELTPDPVYLYLSSRNKEVLAQLMLALHENKGIVKITGVAGTGKTTLCRSFLKQLNAGIDFATLMYPCYSPVELIQSINAEFKLPSHSTNKKELLFQLRTFLTRKNEEGRRVAVVIDEAQNLTPELLEELRILSNLETEKDKLLQVVLIGQPELNKTLDRSSMASLQQRMGAQWDLEPLNVEETHGYIQHRLNVAGGKGRMAFSRLAADVVFRATGGLPRLINRFADQALVEAHLQGVKKIDRIVVDLAVKKLADIQPKPAKGSIFRKLVAALGVIGGLVAIAVYFQTQYSWPDPVSQPQDNLTQMIERNPMNLTQPGQLVPQASPQTRTLSSDSSNPQSPEEASQIPVKFSQQKELVEALSTLTAGESKIEAARWVLKGWGAFKKETVTLTPQARKILKADYGLFVYESNGNLNRLTTLNYPSLVELNLPDGKGPRYLAFVGLKGNVGVFQSNETFEIPLSLFESLWTHKAWVPWKNYEKLPVDMKAGYKGPPAEWLQKKLILLGYYNKVPDLRYGRGTTDAVAKFQRYYNLKDHGRLDTETQMILYNRLPSFNTPKLTGG
jgi:general secretion pathway protein A